LNSGPHTRCRTVVFAVALPALVAAASAACSTGRAASGAPHGRATTPAAHASTSQRGTPSNPTVATGGCGSGQVVSSAGQLRDALAAARPGQTIVLAKGTYTGNFVASVSGTAAGPITLCGGQASVLDGGDIGHGYVFYLNKASWWQLEGFTVTDGQKGVVTDGSSHDLIYGLYVHNIGDEAIHLRSFSSDDSVSHCVIRDTGLKTQFFGEGIYVGSAHSNWCRYTGCQPDQSNDNTISFNDIANTTAENIDIKEGTTGGILMQNTLDGAGMVASAATAWVNVKGNDWTIDGNKGSSSIGDGFQVHQVYPGWGIGNLFKDNTATVDGSGYGIYVQSIQLETVVACNNIAYGAAQGLANVPCTAT
jgi:hypothetical protein